MKSKVIAVLTLLSITLLTVGNWPAAAKGVESKPVALTSASQPQATQDFQDIPTNYLFYQPIHNLFVDGVISGFPCGGPGEPCVPPDNLPYYRPHADVTRDQNAKFIDNGRRKLSGNKYGLDPVLFSVNNVNVTDTQSVGISVQGSTAILASAASQSSGDSWAGNFSNASTNTGARYGIQAYTNGGWGLYGRSQGSTGMQGSAGVVGASDAQFGSGGVFTDTASSGSGVMGYGGTFIGGGFLNANGVFARDDNPTGTGIYAQAAGQLGTGVYGSAYNNITNSAGSPSAVGGIFESYDNLAAHTGLHVLGAGLATGGFATGLGYSMIVKYNGSAEIYPGDILALDGNNAMLDGNKLLGTVKATAENAEAAIGVAAARYNIYYSTKDNQENAVLQADTAASSFHKGDLIQIVIAGQAQVKVSGKANIGDRLAISDDGVSVSKTSTDSIGKLAEQPDQRGMATVFVNFK